MTFPTIFFDDSGNNLDNAQFFLTAGWFDRARQGVGFYRDIVEKRKGKVIVIAGKHKETAIRAALKGKLFNCLITDTETAQGLLDE